VSTSKTPPLYPPAADTPDAVLIVDDNTAIHQMLQGVLQRDGSRQLVSVKSAREARERLLASRFDVVVTDISMPDEDGLSLMRWAAEHCPDPDWIVLTGHGTLDAAIQALQLGAFDFFTKPLESLTALDHSVSNAIERRRLMREGDRLHRELESANEELKEKIGQLESACRLLGEQAETIHADLRRASVIQRALLPRKAPELGNFAVRALYRPSEVVGGDLYDVIRVDSHRTALVMADAAGHGLSAAMLAVVFRQQLSLVDSDTRQVLEPSEVLERVNRALAEDFAAPSLFITAAYALLDTRSGTLCAASAGHPPLLVRRASGEIDRIPSTGPALGLYENARFGQQELELHPGDLLLLHSDGAYEVLDSDHGKPLEAVEQWLRGAGKSDPLQQIAHWDEDVGAHGSIARADDITILLVGSDIGPSSLDNGTPAHAPLGASSGATDAPAPVEVLMGSDSDHIAVSLRGRADWSRSASFYDSCAQALDPGRPLILDLSLCQHMDSTFLGTVHQLCERAEATGAELYLQSVLPSVRALFQELGMKRVLDHVVGTPVPLPEPMHAIEPSELGASEERLRILRAHERLAELNEQNRGEFDPLIEVLRREVEAARGTRSEDS